MYLVYTYLYTVHFIHTQYIEYHYRHNGICRAHTNVHPTNTALLTYTEIGEIKLILCSSREIGNGGINPDIYMSTGSTWTDLIL